MAYIKKSVNIVLLVLLALIIASFIGFTTYYEQVYKNISVEHNLKLSQVAELNKNVSTQKEELSKINTELQQKIRDKEKFDALYTDVVEEKDVLSAELSSTIASLKKTQADLETANEEIRSLNAEVKDLQGELDEKEEEISVLNNRISTWLCFYNSTFC